MAHYDYESGKERIENILDNKLVVKESNIPKDDNFTFSNAYYGWVTGVFIDIRNSTKLFQKDDKEFVSKIIRSFTSEVIEILRKDDYLREIGIRGDCVYAIYSTPFQHDIYEVSDKVFYINTFMKMLNKMLNKRGVESIYVGIGISTAQELVVKAGRKDTGINSKVWIGEAVTKASNLSSLGNKGLINPVVFSSSTYTNIIDKLLSINKDAKSWFTEVYDSELGTYYHADITNITFNDWIDKEDFS